MKLFGAKNPDDEKKNRENKCRKEIAKALDKYNCELTIHTNPSVVITAKPQP